MRRRDFLQVASAVAAGAIVGPDHEAEDVNTLYNRSIVIDSLSIEDWDDAGFVAWRRSGYTAIQTSLPNRNFAVAAHELLQWAKRFQQHTDKLIHCTRAADIARAKREGKLAVILGFQNGTVIDDVSANVDKLYSAGARCIQLTYNSRNLLGDGCTERTNSGLSDFGIECVERMNRLGIIVDLSHCGEQTSRDGIALSRRPPCFTHTVCGALHAHPRAKSDELLRAMSKGGGMTGIAALGYFVGPTADTTFDNYLDHIDHAVKVCGIENVGICTDFPLRGIEASSTRDNWYLPRLKEFKPSYNVRWPPWIRELDKPERFRTVALGLTRRGYRSSDIEKVLGRNWLRYFREIFGA